MESPIRIHLSNMFRITGPYVLVALCLISVRLIVNLNPTTSSATSSIPTTQVNPTTLPIETISSQLWPVILILGLIVPSSELLKLIKGNNNKEIQQEDHANQELKEKFQEEQLVNTINVEGVDRIENKLTINIEDTNKLENIEQMLCQAQGSLKEPLHPCAEGVSGTYFLQHPDNSSYVAVFKPVDEEPNAPNNPKSKSSNDESSLEGSRRGGRKGVPPGQGAIREVAAYLIDREDFSKVPPTTLVEFFHPHFSHAGTTNKSKSETLNASILPTTGTTKKRGSLQMFIEHECSSSDMGPSKFSLRSVHRIGIFDIRTVNLDRHGANLLVVSERQQQQKRIDFSETSRVDEKTRYPNHQMELIPIDHSFCFPETLEDIAELWFEWMNWPQAKQPFDEETKKYVLSIDEQKDLELLAAMGFSPSSLVIFQSATQLLKFGVRQGMSLYEIASELICRPNFETPSRLENLVRTANPLLVTT